MKPQELRIENIVYVPDTDQIVPITSINMDIGVIVNRSLRVLSFNEIEPIELTEYWLIKFGFEKTIGGRTKTIWFSIDSLRILIEKGKFIPIGKGIDLKSVHQLQNLYFALTGEELIIKEQ